MSLTSVDLPEPDTPVTATKQPSGKSTSMFLQVVLAGAPDREPLVARLAAHARAPGCVRLPDRYWPVIDALFLSSPLTVPGVDDVAAVLAGAGADVDHVVGDPDRLLVVLDDEHGVAEVAQADERLDEAAVVALVQADRRLVEHVEHADQAAADLARPGGCAAPRRRRACRPSGRA